MLKNNGIERTVYWKGSIVMDRQMIWKILDLEPTKDETVLKNRYHELLLKVNPEDDPEGFKQLRQAYEAAVEWANRSEDERKETDKPKDEIDLWMERVQDVYWYARTRNDPEIWKQLFDDPVCVALDLALKTRNRFLAYLTDHTYVTQEIWQLIDKEFNILADKKELQEWYPAGFLDFIQYQVEHPQFFAYQWLEIQGIDEAEISIDSYISAYFNIKAAIDRMEYDNLWQSLDNLRAYEVYHPYEDVERIRLYLVEQKKEDAVSLAKRLLERYPDDIYVGYWAGRAYWAIEEWEQAYQCWCHVTDILPNHYLAMVGIAKYKIKVQDYLDAKEQIMDLLEMNGGDETVLAMMREVNVPLIAYYWELAEQEPERKEHAVEACWCMFQNEQFQETIEALEKLNLQPEDKEYYDYVNMKGRCYLGLRQYEDAIRYLKQWETCRQNLVDDGSDKYKRRISREGYIKSAIGVAYQNLKMFGEAEHYLKEGIAVEQDDMMRHGTMDRLALLYYENHRLERCIDEYSQILEEDPGYYPAYLRRQQAYFDLKDGQHVIDDYYNAIRIFPKYYKPYLLAVRVFCIYRQYEDAKKVIEAAKEQSVMEDSLRLYEVRVLRNLAQTLEESQRAMEVLLQFKKEFLEREGHGRNVEYTEDNLSDEDMVDQEMKQDGMPQDRVERKDLVFEEILICMDMNRLDDAMTYLLEELNNGSTDYRLYRVKADIHRIKQEYAEALKEYSRLRNVEELDQSDIEYNCGCAMNKLGRIEDAIVTLKKALQINPRHPRANHELMRIYKGLFTRYELQFAYDQALSYMQKQIELVPDAYYYIELGLLYMDNYMLEPALEAYQKALEQEEDNPYAYNNIGYVLRVKGDFEQAISYFTQSIHYMDDERTLLPYINMAICYQALNQPKEGISVLQAAMRRFTPTASVYENMAELYTMLGDFTRAEQLCSEALRQKTLNKFDYYEQLMRIVYLPSGDRKMIEKTFQLWLEYIRYYTNSTLDINLSLLKADQRNKMKETIKYIEKKKTVAYGELGSYYLYMRKLKKAIRYLKAGWKLAKKHGNHYVPYGIRLTTAYLLSGQKERAALTAKEMMHDIAAGAHVPECWKKEESPAPETEEAYLSYRPEQPIRLYRFAILHFASGDRERAMQYLDQACRHLRCEYCAFRSCYDVLCAKANFAEADGDIDGAIRFYRQAAEINPLDCEIVITLKILEKKQRKKEKR